MAADDPCHIATGIKKGQRKLSLFKSDSGFLKGGRRGAFCRLAVLLGTHAFDEVLEFF
jgi:hypothetical protein